MLSYTWLYVLKKKKNTAIITPQISFQWYKVLTIIDPYSLEGKTT